MPKTSTAKNPHGVSITFTEEDHSYVSLIDGKELSYTSVTSLIGMFFPKFDAERIAPLSARKQGLTVEAILAKWKKTAEDACALGTKIHETCEDTILGNPERNVPASDNEARLMEVARRTARRIADSMEILGVEKLIFNEKLKIAGTIDLLVRSKKTGRIYILDWKSNKRILKENDFGKKGLGPISHLDDCNYNHYALQLSIYQHILRETGYVSSDTEFGRALIHLTEYDARMLKIPFLGTEVCGILDVFENKKEIYA